MEDEYPHEQNDGFPPIDSLESMALLVMSSIRQWKTISKSNVKDYSNNRSVKTKNFVRHHKKCHGRTGRYVLDLAEAFAKTMTLLLRRGGHGPLIESLHKIGVHFD